MPSATSAVDVRVRHAEHVMGTVVSFDVPGSACHDGSLEAAIRWLYWVDRVFSPYRADSDVSLLARAEVTVDACAPEMAEVLAACAVVRDLSGGYFTVAPGGQFDPSGYVKGWAVERAAALLACAGSADHVVNGGGDVQCAGGRGHGVGGAESEGSRRVGQVLRRQLVDRIAVQTLVDLLVGRHPARSHRNTAVCPLRAGQVVLRGLHGRVRGERRQDRLRRARAHGDYHLTWFRPPRLAS